MQVSKFRLNSVTMTFPVSFGDTIAQNDFNATQSILEDVLGLGENGYGLTSIQSNPISNTSRVKATQWNYLLADLDAVSQHITGQVTNISYVSTGTTAITNTMINDMYNTALSLEPSRYTVDSSQFLVSTGTSTTFYTGGTSLRTLPWGVATNVITHRVVTEFPNRLAARYYFNLGSYLTLTPYYEGIGLNDLDAEWGNFIDYINLPGNQYQYGRTQYTTYGSTTTAWTSGTLHVSVTANRATDQASIEFVTTYSNDASPNLLITPAVGIYNITL